jgi:MerR family transcriptional regulator, copper efflux regulator
MTAFTIQDVSRRSGLSEPTLRYYEEVGLIGPIDRAECQCDLGLLERHP